MWWGMAVAYYMIMNVYAWLMTRSDKRLARQRGRRVSESALYRMAWLGGAAGMYAAMRVYRHKTQHPGFRFGVPLIGMLHAGLIGYAIVRFGV